MDAQISKGLRMSRRKTHYGEQHNRKECIGLPCYNANSNKELVSLTKFEKLVIEEERQAQLMLEKIDWMFAKEFK